MRVIDRQGEVADPVFVDGEPDLEPPEELAVEVLDEAALLRDDLGCEMVDENDLDLDWADQAFDELVHAADEAAADDPAAWLGEAVCRGCLQVLPRHAVADRAAGLCHACMT